MLHKPLTKSKNPTSSSRASNLEHFVQNKPIGTDIQAGAAGKSAEFWQSCLVALGHRRKPLQYFLIVGKVVVEAGKIVVEATDQLFKSHYVFVVHFAQVIQNFWEFMASEVYRVMPASSSKASDLDDFMNSSGDDGVIILSLGTYVKVMPQRLNDLFASVFAKLQQKVVWQLPDNSPTKLSSNVKTMGWLPQNDLLGHPKTKLFIYQGGNNGLYEALYHGVPTLVLPVFADQLCVASRVLEKGMGSYLDIHTLSAENLDKAIRMILNNESYAETAKRLSAIYRDRPETPAERAAYWVEHVLKFGGKYMESPAKHLGFIQLSLIDVTAFLLLCLIVVIVVIFFTCRFMFRCCIGMCKDGSKKKKD